MCWCNCFPGVSEGHLQSPVLAAQSEGQTTAKVQIPLLQGCCLRLAGGNGERLCGKLQAAPQLGHGTAHAV